jgi:hypothetical protein
MALHDLLNFAALLLSGILGGVIATPARRKLAVVRRRIDDGRARRS